LHFVFQQKGKLLVSALCDDGVYERDNSSELGQSERIRKMEKELRTKLKEKELK